MSVKLDLNLVRDTFETVNAFTQNIDPTSTDNSYEWQHRRVAYNGKSLVAVEYGRSRLSTFKKLTDLVQNVLKTKVGDEYKPDVNDIVFYYERFKLNYELKNNNRGILSRLFFWIMGGYRQLARANKIIKDYKDSNGLKDIVARIKFTEHCATAGDIESAAAVKDVKKIIWEKGKPQHVPIDQYRTDVSKK